MNAYLTPKADDEAIARQVVNLVDAVEASAGASAYGELGGCWLWLVDNTHAVTQALLQTDRVVVNKDGKYLMRLDGFSEDRSLRQREKMTQQIASQVTQ